MKLRESLLGFNNSHYREKISDREYSYATLARNIYRKRRAIGTSKKSALTGAAAVHVTGGMSLVGAAWSARNIAVEKNKLQLLEEEWLRRGQKKLRDLKTAKNTVNLRITSTAGAVAFTVDFANPHATEEGAQEAAFGTPEYEFNGHLVGAYHHAVEKAEQKLGNATAVNTLS